MLKRGFALREVVVLFLLLPAVGTGVYCLTARSREISNRSLCSANLAGIYKAAYTYSVIYDDSFPMASARDPLGVARGFHEGNRELGTGVNLDQNSTASLWLMVRIGSTPPKIYICPSSRDEADPLTIGIGDSRPAPIANTHDFVERKNLSYSMVNPFHVGVRWWGELDAGRVILGDNNNNDHVSRHTLQKGAATPEDVAQMENSANHDYEGQNFLFGGSHVEFRADPFVGLANDNVYAMVKEELDAPPTLGNSDGDAAHDPAVAQVDDVLLPVSGNQGVSLSGKRMDLYGRGADRRMWGAFVVLVVLSALGLSWALLRRKRSATPAGTPGVEEQAGS